MNAESRATLNEVHTIFVYSHNIDKQIVGNSRTMHMGVFPLKGAHGDQVSWQFNHVHYIDVQKSYIPSITMKLGTPTGERAPFLNGDTLCRLHFFEKCYQRSQDCQPSHRIHLSKRLPNTIDKKRGCSEHGNSRRAKRDLYEPFQITEGWRRRARLSRTWTLSKWTRVWRLLSRPHPSSHSHRTQRGQVRAFCDERLSG